MSEKHACQATDAGKMDPLRRVPCGELATVKRNGRWVCPRHDFGDFKSRPKQKIENQYKIGQSVELKNGMKGEIVKLSPAGKQGVTIMVDPVKQSLHHAFKTSILKVLTAREFCADSKVTPTRMYVDDIEPGAKYGQHFDD